MNSLLTLSQQPVPSCGFDTCECTSDSVTQIISKVTMTVSKEGAREKSRKAEGERKRDQPSHPNSPSPQEGVEEAS